MDWIRLYITQDACSLIQLKSKDAHYESVSCDWCYVMYSTVFSGINNLQSRCDRKVSKFFICDKSPFPSSSGFIMGMPTCPAPGQYFQGSTTCRSMETCQFFVILNQGVSLWT